MLYGRTLFKFDFEGCTIMLYILVIRYSYEMESYRLCSATLGVKSIYNSAKRACNKLDACTSIFDRGCNRFGDYHLCSQRGELGTGDPTMCILKKRNVYYYKFKMFVNPSRKLQSNTHVYNIVLQK